MKLLDVVATMEDIPKAHLAKGQVGTVVDELDGDVVLVEFADLDGVAYAIEPIAVRQLIELRHTPAMAAQIEQWDQKGQGRIIYGEHEALIAFDGALHAGDLPHRALSMVREWLAVHRAEIEADWALAQALKPINPIAPLE